MSSRLETTRRSYDTVAADYHELVAEGFPADPYHRSVLGLFVDLVTGGGGGLVGDLGCGPGQVAVYLAGLGLDVVGIDLSPEMVRVARSEYPEVRFEVGSLFGLELPDKGLAGAVVWNALVHTPADELPLAPVRRDLPGFGAWGTAGALIQDRRRQHASRPRLLA